MTFRTIVADFPWPYDDRLNDRNRGAANHYGLMSLDALRRLDLRSVADPDGSHLYLWATNAFVDVAYDIMRGYGWTPKTMLTWVKPQIGMGHYYRNNTEHVVFGVRGSLAALRKDVPTSFVADRADHSAKPGVFYAVVEGMSPGPRLDVFARTPRDGWTVVGDGVSGEDVTVSLRRLAPPTLLPWDDDATAGPDGQATDGDRLGATAADGRPESRAGRQTQLFA